MKMTKEEFKAMLDARLDIHPSMKEVHLQRMDRYCLATRFIPVEKDEFEITAPGCNGYHLICENKPGHAENSEYPHYDIQGGIAFDSD